MLRAILALGMTMLPICPVDGTRAVASPAHMLGRFGTGLCRLRPRHGLLAMCGRPDLAMRRLIVCGLHALACIRIPGLIPESRLEPADDRHLDRRGCGLDELTHVLKLFENSLAVHAKVLG
jgi:hypothetical protein